MAPSVAVVAAGAMGSGIARLLTRNGVTVLTNLDGRSEATRRRAVEAGMQDAPFAELRKCPFMLSILPPSDAHSLAERYVKEPGNETQDTVFVDANAVNPVTVKKIAALFTGTRVKFVDAGIIGGPPTDSGYNPTFYASADDSGALASFEQLSAFGLKISALRDNEAGIGDASALKMSYAGITKGTTGLFTTMILAAYQASPATAEALLKELAASQPMLLGHMSTSIPRMVPKAYRWVAEMEEIGKFVGEPCGEIYRGMAKLYGRIDESRNGDGRDIENLQEFCGRAK
ncbi:NAD-binding phosphogluconate dehydrogenase-like protein [Mycena kentingensis (nom. inval.)]|nr:NAD-binding phosphogluconate dehydrogenase-like protein [Mycena kentingensis (nom. inval.)]